MDYKQAEDYIFSYTDYEKLAVPHALGSYDLRRVEELLGRLGNPHLGAKSVHITGTKGKGSVAAMVASALIAAGYKTGLFTSPHLISWRERVKVNNQPISEDEFVRLVEKLKAEVETVNEKATYGKLTTFELLTALGFTFFKEKSVDFQVLEVGMGGRFDATNVILPEVSIITSISLDHTEVLGPTLALIAAEKAGIIKPNTPVVISPQARPALAVIKHVCEKNDAALVQVGTDVSWQSMGFDENGQSLRVKGLLDSYNLTIPLLGQHQMENAAVAVAALEVLQRKGFKVSRQSIISGLAGVKWPGRLQILSRDPLLVVDGAHNPDSACKLRLALEQYFGLSHGKYKPAVLVIGVSSDKDISGIAVGLAPIFERVIVTRSRHPRAMATERVVAEFGKNGLQAQISDNVPEAIALAKTQAGTKGLVCVTGSLFVVGEAMQQAGATPSNRD